MEHSGEASTNETNSLAMELNWLAPLELGETWPEGVGGLWVVDMFWNTKRADRVQNTNEVRESQSHMDAKFSSTP